MQPWIRQALTERRVAAGLSMADVAYLMRVASGGDRKTDKAVLSKMENGTQGVQDYMVEGYAEALGVPPQELWRDALDRWEAAENAAGKKGREATRRARAAVRRRGAGS